MNKQPHLASAHSLLRQATAALAGSSPNVERSSLAALGAPPSKAKRTRKVNRRAPAPASIPMGAEYKQHVEDVISSVDPLAIFATSPIVQVDDLYLTRVLPGDTMLGITYRFGMPSAAVVSLLRANPQAPRSMVNGRSVMDLKAGQVIVLPGVWVTRDLHQVPNHTAFENPFAIFAAPDQGQGYPQGYPQGFPTPDQEKQIDRELDHLNESLNNALGDEGSDGFSLPAIDLTDAEEIVNMPVVQDMIAAFQSGISPADFIASILGITADQLGLPLTPQGYLATTPVDDGTSVMGLGSPSPMMREVARLSDAETPAPRPRRKQDPISITPDLPYFAPAAFIPNRGGYANGEERIDVDGLHHRHERKMTFDGSNVRGGFMSLGAVDDVLTQAFVDLLYVCGSIGGAFFAMGLPEAAPFAVACCAIAVAYQTRTKLNASEQAAKEAGVKEQAAKDAASSGSGSGDGSGASQANAGGSSGGSQGSGGSGGSQGSGGSGGKSASSGGGSSSSSSGGGKTMSTASSTKTSKDRAASAPAAGGFLAQHGTGLAVGLALGIAVLGGGYYLSQRDKRASS